ncbi:MAG: RecX family transcriptional regulator [Cyclobacteriaceae bacterium]|nr:RecX family transcriptional regulator [Cyclobacteriaceae bacterium]
MSKRVSPEEARNKILRYCAYQERAHQEVKNKLYSFGLYSSQVNELISYLITEGFLSEERYAKAFAGGKFRMKKWGRLKIVRELEAKGLTTNCIKIGLREIDQADYTQTLRQLVAKKAAEVTEENPFAKRNKVARYIIQKGYEPELVWHEVKEFLQD